MSVLIDSSITIYEALEHIKDGKICYACIPKTVCVEHGTD